MCSLHEFGKHQHKEQLEQLDEFVQTAHATGTYQTYQPIYSCSYQPSEMEHRPSSSSFDSLFIELKPRVVDATSSTSARDTARDTARAPCARLCLHVKTVYQANTPVPMACSLSCRQPRTHCSPRRSRRHRRQMMQFHRIVLPTRKIPRRRNPSRRKHDTRKRPPDAWYEQKRLNR